MRNRTLKLTMAAGVLVALAGLTACSGGASNSSTMDSGSGGSLAAPEPGSDSPGGTDEKAAPGANRTVVTPKAIIRTGEVSLTAKDLAKVRDDIDALMAAVGGSVGSEESSHDRHGRLEQSTVVLRVPVGKFQAAKSALMKMGKLQTSDETSKDVTTQVIDVEERVQTLQNSLDDLQRFQRSAKDVKDLLDFEEKITQRQSELQSLKAQQAYLTDQTSMSTITVHLSTPEKYVPPPDALEGAGFLAGLKAGWNALGDVFVVSLTVFGALLPFLGVALLVGVPAWLGIRSLVRRRKATPRAEAPAS
jgi:Domain of unknown function (DUF4349)